MVVKINGALTIKKKKSTISKRVEQCPSFKAMQTYGETDFSIIVGEKSVKVHKRLLLDKSSYFVGMFNSGMIEATEMKTTITDFDYEIVEAGIQLLYNPSKLPYYFTFEQRLELLRFSDKYGIQAIKNLMQDLFIANISTTNVCALINFTTTIVSAPKLYNKCVQYLQKCSKESKAVHGLETLDKDFVFKMYCATFTKAL